MADGGDRMATVRRSIMDATERQQARVSKLKAKVAGLERDLGIAHIELRCNIEVLKDLKQSLAALPDPTETEPASE